MTEWLGHDLRRVRILKNPGELAAYLALYSTDYKTDDPEEDSDAFSSAAYRGMELGWFSGRTCEDYLCANGTRTTEDILEFLEITPDASDKEIDEAVDATILRSEFDAFYLCDPQKMADVVRNLLEEARRDRLP